MLAAEEGHTATVNALAGTHGANVDAVDDSDNSKGVVVMDGSAGRRSLSRLPTHLETESATWSP